MEAYTVILTFVCGLLLGYIYALPKYPEQAVASPENPIAEDEIYGNINTDSSTPKGEFIVPNYTSTYLKEHKGDVKLGDIIEEN